MKTMLKWIDRMTQSHPINNPTTNLLIVMAFVAASFAFIPASPNLKENQVVNKSIRINNIKQIINLKVKLVANKWVKNTETEQLGELTFSFKDDNSFELVSTKLPSVIAGSYQLAHDTLRIDDNQCKTTAIYQVTMNDSGLNFKTIEDACNGRNVATPGLWKIKEGE